MPEFHVHWTTVAAGTAAYFAIGAIWYGILAGPWVTAVGLTREQVQQESAGRIYAIQLVATFALVVLATYVLHDALAVDGPLAGLVGGLLLGTIASLAASGDFLYEPRRRSAALFLINSGYRIVATGVLGVLVALLD